MARQKKGIRMAIAEAVEIELDNMGALAEETEERSLDEELDFERQDFGIIEEEES